jgi:hypothetical protein
MSVAVPNFGELANQQYGANTQATNLTNLANRPNQYNPMGSTTYTMNPDGSWGTNTSLSVAAQGLFDASISGQQALAGQVGQGLDYSSLGAMPQVGQYNQDVINSWNALQAPSLDAGDTAARSRAAAQGLTMGSDPWMDMTRAQGNIRTDAGNKAILAGYQQGNTEFNQALAARQQGAGELQNRFTGATSGMSALGNARDSLNPNKWSPNVPASAAYLPKTIYGAAQDTFNAQRQNENARLAASQGNTEAGVNILRALGGTQGLPGIYAGAKNIYGDAKDLWGSWGSPSSVAGTGQYPDVSMGSYYGDSGDSLGDFISANGWV